MTSNQDLMARREAAVPRGVSSMHPRFFARGSNAEVFDAEGTRYIDLATGIAVCFLPALTMPDDLLAEAMERLTGLMQRIAG